MVINGQAVKGAKRLANHLLKDENEKVSILEISGVAINDSLYHALRDMEDMGKLTNSQSGKVLYHANINPRKNEMLTPEQYIKSCDALMEKLKFVGQPRAIVLHQKNGREHAHLVVQLADIEKRKLKPISNNYYKHKEVSRELEKSFELAKTNEEKSGRSYNQAEAQQAKRLSKRQKSIRNIIRTCYEYSKDGSDFVSRLAQNQFYLAMGKRVVVIDSLGNPLSLTRQLRHFKTSKEIKDKISDVLNNLPTVENVQAQVRSLNSSYKLENSSLELLKQKRQFRQDRQFNFVQESMTNMIDYCGRRNTNREKDRDR
ncbi:hypothetical protein BFP97_17870 [Roseivirga sp. 4D4]|uniref:relaxase/mobilization nuclease domain-containing protein n=1 Tax=Roseivirga sp. 4D4 TaxID=1889784 RepID=UPI000853040D|nr:relaxase/mobilization nuclease domain-containing protein [Roseivirga sp. 4D4]OEK03278.1 hypothetical protein BFP97_17870 [Roseivirga sp. 4D4]